MKGCAYQDTFASRVKYCRVKMGLTQEQLAEKAKVSTQFVSYVEQGRTNVRTDYIIQIADALEISIDFLLRGEINANDADHLAARIAKLSGSNYMHLCAIVEEFCASHQSE